jgi:hypothetical protein
MTLYTELSKYRNLKNYKGEFGVEIETEGLKAYDRPGMAFWTVHVDDSLRGPAPYEYVLKQPLDFKEQIPQALEEFKLKTEGIKFDEKSFTTSVHVHVNMLNETFLTLGNFLTTYCIVENLLKKFAGENRESNLFCLTLTDAEENFQNMLHIINCIKGKHFSNLELDQGSTKYAALNLCSLYKYGSLEIRLLRGTTDTNLIYDWLSLLNSVLKFSRQDMTPKDVIWSWRQKGTELLSDIFGQHRKLLRFGDDEKIIDTNFWFAANAAMSVPDWRVLDQQAPVKKLNAKILDEVAVKNFGKPFDELPEEHKIMLIKHYKWVDDVPAKPKKKQNMWMDEGVAQVQFNAMVNAVAQKPAGMVPPPWIEEAEQDHEEF